MATRPRSGHEIRRPPGRPPKLPHRVREELLLDVATAIFAERGSAASLDAIGRESGVNKALIYEHFESKDDLFAKAVLRGRERLVDFIAARYGRAVHRPRRERVRDQFHAFTDFASQHPTIIRLLALPEATFVLARAGRGSAPTDLAGYLRGELTRMRLPTNELPKILAAMFVGMTMGVIRDEAAGSWDREAVVDLMTDFVLAGLAGVDADVYKRADTPKAKASTPPESAGARR